jgi:hypothetical protein
LHGHDQHLPYYSKRPKPPVSSQQAHGGRTYSPGVSQITHRAEVLSADPNDAGRRDRDNKPPGMSFGQQRQAAAATALSSASSSSVATAVDGAGNAIAVFGSSYSWHLAGGTWDPATALPAGSSGGLIVADPAGTFVYAAPVPQGGGALYEG